MRHKTILITGSGGMLGSELMQCKWPNYYFEGLDRDIDVSNEESVCLYLAEKAPDIIIHTASYTDVDGCERDPGKARSVNVTGTQNIVNYCIENNTLLVFISSTGVYGNQKADEYTEYDTPLPTTVHHKTKLEAENIIRDTLSRYLILRTGWLYGGDKSQKKNFVYKRLIDAQSQMIIYSDPSQLGNPTSIEELVIQIHICIKNNLNGVFNCVNKASNVSRYEYVAKIFELYGVECEIGKGDAQMFSRLAPVAKNESAVNLKLDALGLNIMADWSSALNDYIKKIGPEI